jgi:hypothetical protein
MQKAQAYRRLHQDVFDAAGMVLLATLPAAPLATLRSKTLEKVEHALQLDGVTRALARTAAAAREARDARCDDGGSTAPLLELKQRPSSVDVGGCPFFELAEARGLA